MNFKKIIICLASVVLLLICSIVPVFADSNNENSYTDIFGNYPTLIDDPSIQADVYENYDLLLSYELGNGIFVQQETATIKETALQCSKVFLNIVDQYGMQYLYQVSRLSIVYEDYYTTDGLNDWYHPSWTLQCGFKGSDGAWNMNNALEVRYDTIAGLTYIYYIDGQPRIAIDKVEIYMLGRNTTIQDVSFNRLLNRCKFNMYSAVSYDLGYAEGESAGLDAGYDNGYDVGFEEGKDVGYDEGWDVGYEVADESGFPYTFKEFIFTLFSAPGIFFNDVLNFELFGINMAGLVKFLISTALIGSLVAIMFKLFGRFI